MAASAIAVPDGWRVVRLGEVADVKTGGTPRRSESSYWGGNIPWMASGEINQRRLKYTSERITQVGLDDSNAELLPPGTVMVAMNGQGATRGKTCLLGIEASCNQSLAGLLARTNLSNSFLFHFLDSSYHRLRSITGDGRNGLNLGIIRSFPILLPPLSEQRAIAAVLDGIDDAIESSESVIAATERLRDSLLHELLTRGVPGWHTEWRHARGVGTVPASWRVVRLGEVADVKGGKRLPKGNSYADEDTSLPYIRVVDFKDRTVDSRNLHFLRHDTYQAIKRYTISSEDVYISIAGTIGLAGTVPSQLDGANLTENAAKIVIRNPSRFTNHYLSSYLNSLSGQTQIKLRTQTSTQPKLALKHIKTILVPVPFLPEQQTIAAMLHSVDAAVENHRRETDALRSLKASSADALLTGRARM